MAEYWANDSRTPGTYDKICGAIFSCLSTLDGSSINIPGYYLVPIGSIEDAAFQAEHEENFYPVPPDDVIEPFALPPMLHEHWHRFEKQPDKRKLS